MCVAIARMRGGGTLFPIRWIPRSRSVNSKSSGNPPILLASASEIYLRLSGCITPAMFVSIATIVPHTRFQSAQTKL